MKTYFIPTIAGALLILGSAIVFAQEPKLTIETRDQKKVFLQSELLRHKELETIHIKNDPAYPNREMTYKAIKVTTLFRDLRIADQEVIQFKALDGFSAPLSKQRLLNTNKANSIAYLAIELPDKKWPQLKAGKPSAGPFYLVWQSPELSQIGTEEWPFMLAGFEVKGSLSSLYPKILPDENLTPESSIYKGFQLFVKNCFACHTLNKSGASQVGPDLNVPMNPTEYFQDSVLRKVIRNPQDLRHWPNSKMNGFSADQLNDVELDQIILYLKHMATRKF